MRKRKATIADVAKLAGTSLGTVSHVLSGRAQVSEDLRTRVNEAVAALGFVPSFHAQGIRGRHSRVIGVCFPHVSTSYLNNVSERIEIAASESGYRLIHVFSRQDVATELLRVKELLQYGVTGLVLFPGPDPSGTLEELARSGTHAVVLDREGDLSRFDHVILDHRKSMMEATLQLIGFGHRRILFVARSSRNVVTRHRLPGFYDALSSISEANGEHIELNPEEAAGAAELLYRLKAPGGPTALILSNSRHAAAALMALRSAGLTCPRDLSVLAFDDPDWSELVQPRLSVVRQPAAAIAEAAWSLLLSRIANPQRPYRVATFEHEVLIRESVGPAPVSRSRRKAAPAIR